MKMKRLVGEYEVKNGTSTGKYYVVIEEGDGELSVIIDHENKERGFHRTCIFNEVYASEFATLEQIANDVYKQTQNEYLDEFFADFE